ncbi:MAG: hypothetical protein IT319_19835 [Anaerolineae bacterium]|nr:hypothetical protein [Anaerolineae bacterium]
MIVVLLLLVSGCGATAVQVVPTARPTTTPTSTGAPTRTPARDVTPTTPPTSPPTTPTGGPSPTPLFGPTVTAVDAQPTSLLNPNAPRIEFFTSDASAVAPGSTVTLYWSTRGARDAVIYQLVRGVRNRVWNVGPDGSLPVATNRSDRGTADFVLQVGEGSQFVEQNLSIPLACPDAWFFQPPPETCPRPAEETQLIEEPFERGRMVYVASTDQIYALFNDGLAPAWMVVQNRFDPAIHPESDPSFAAALPPGYYQPLRRLGFVWRGNDTIRNRLGLGIQPEASYTGFIQTSVSTDGAQTLYISSADSTVLELLPQGAAWQIITSPS